MPEQGLPAAVWRKSTRSQQNGACVEAAFLSTAVAVRDSKDPHGPQLILTKDQWRAFVQELKQGSFRADSGR